MDVSDASIRAGHPPFTRPAVVSVCFKARPREEEFLHGLIHADMFEPDADPNEIKMTVALLRAGVSGL